MALARMTALKDFRVTALSTTAVTTGYQLGALTTGQRLYMAMHLTSASLGTTARMLLMAIQSATASGFGAPTTQGSFLLSSAQGGEVIPPVSNLSTEHSWFRASWTLSTGVSTGGTWKGLVEVGIKQF